MAQHKYSVGDRVRVLWEDALCDGGVTKVHPSGAIDVAFDKTGSIGVSLSATKHIFHPLGEDGNPLKPKEPVVVKKVKVRVCIFTGVLMWHAGRCSVRMYV